MRQITFLAMAALCLAFLNCSAPASVDAQEIEAMFQKQLPPAPRLFLLRGEENELKQRIEADEQLKAVWGLIRRTADAMLDEPPVERKMEGRRLLGESRRCLRRLTHLGLSYRLTGDQRYADRGKQELLAAAAFSDWNPSHFLDVAEMTAALAIGVDWLHDGLDEQTRATVRGAIVKMGLEPSITAGSWAKAKNNWNQVCNAGMTLGALVVAEEHKQLAGQMISRAIEGVPFAMKEYGPDGNYPEGPMYWEYGTTFNVLLIAALQKGMGTDFDLLKQPGFDRTADYTLHVKGPTGLWFNYADCGQPGSFSPSPAMHYLASWLKQPALLHGERKMIEKLVAKGDAVSTRSTDRLLPLLLIWATPGIGQAVPSETHFVGHGMTPVALFRSSWSDDATFAGIKAGQGSAPHGHMDVGTFVIDMMGTRFAEDLGMQSYHSLESIGVNLWNGPQDGVRWKIFRLGAKSHNVLTVNGQDPLVNGRAEIVSSSNRSAKLDLSRVYSGQLESASRELTLREDGSVVIADELQSTGEAAVVRWALATRAKPTLDAGGATLTRDGKQVKMIVSGTKSLEMKIFATDPKPADYDATNEGVTMLGFEHRFQPGEKAQWTVEFIPVK